MQKHYFPSPYAWVIFLLYFAMLLLTVSTGCYKLKPVSPNDTAPDWEKVDYTADHLIQDIHATPFELYAISEREFSRFSKNDTLIEKRSLLAEDGVIGRPILHDNVFVRYAVSGGQDVIEFYHPRNFTQAVFIPTSTLQTATDNKVEIDEQARYNGAFNEEGDQFLLLCIVNFSYSAFLFDITQNADFSKFVSIELTHRIDLPDIVEGEDQLQCVRFLDGNYYVGSKDGAYRITPTGEANRIFSENFWVLDFFSYRNSLYMTGYNSYDMHISSNSGTSWTRLNRDSDLQEIEVLADTVLTHQSLGFPYKLVDAEKLIEAENIRYDHRMKRDDSDNNAYFGVAYFNNRYYFSYQKSIFSVSAIFTEE